VELYFHSSIRLHGVVLSYRKAQGKLYLYLFVFLVAAFVTLIQKT
jgi:hypothetical protein